MAGQANLGAERMCQHGTKSIKLASRELLAPGCAPVAAQFQLLRQLCESEAKNITGDGA